MTEATDQLTELPLPQLLNELESSAAGLTAAEALQRLQHYGPNEIAERHRNPVLVFLGYFWAPIPWMIEVALALSVAARHWTDAVIIGVLLAMNGLVAFFEEHQAANAIGALKQRLASAARVLRDGAWVTVAVRELVPGDVVRVRLGDVVPADLRVLDDVTLEVDQSAMTGESLAVSRGQGESLFSGSVLVRGEADALVCATGVSSYMGKTTALVESAGTVSHFQRAVLRIANYLIVIAVALVTLTVVVSLVRGNPVLETLEFALVVTIASIPVALPAVLSVTMAVGARQLAHQEAVVSHLPAVEELGGIDLLCSDKTGTLTQNRLAVAARWTTPAMSDDELLVIAALASRAEDNDVIDLAVLAAAGQRPAARVEQFVPFDPVSKRTEALVRDADGQTFRVSKGAPQVIAALCDGDGATTQVDDVVERFATHGYRSLGVARTDGDGSWRLIGVLGLADPPRDDSAATITAAKELGIDVKMVTGDQVAIGREIARQVGLGEQILDAAILNTADDGDLAARVEATDGFAQVFPEHKYRIVQLLQARGHIVGMTGDGVNDAPALKQADAGIAVDGATDAARAAADVVLLAPGLSVIVAAIAQAREIFARLTSYATYRIAETIRVLLLITLAVVFMNFFPVTAAMIVFLALLNDGAILSIAYDHVRGSSKPVKWDMRSVLTIATVLGIIGVVATFTLFFLADRVFHLSHDLIRTMIYLKLSAAGQLTIFLTRARGPFWSRPAPAPLLLGAVVAAQTVATLISVYGMAMTPLGWRWAGLVWAYAVAWFLINDRVKLATYYWLDRHPRRENPNRWRAKLHTA
ncbi:plasma-membrane proton-efflux P-type ATPase [Mycobacterium malmoense]|uniref:Plasma-membrane proton-efflux P-type ATPase n=1 Tax=Mycobacterium malmoense TaxID=1780 RepID=A0ABX3STK0_MYCMA|nr:plasma-membrane proton-efflux P-type ATPase [Mycobacterium malmoense]OIN78916.1 plasma-membrane proton-efflux P-type ATPase [Mycobacterium malmoense]ORA83668.1 plasma-membrane proton-efflux P-type ATPase [Mycobacterium malmoense]QZA18783.1 plasma-membrane proton-efflux P-type ATPase [Mycobacterium malmoense]UNB95553.1 plasma-membrane proton-efflux P-type ATPase [Mycobacterium malmoense]